MNKNKSPVTNLILKTTDIGVYSSSELTSDTIEDNVVGTLSKMRTEATFKNINFKKLLGDEYDKYDKFAIELVQVQSLVNPTGGNTLRNNIRPENSILNLYLSGLSFINSTYRNNKNTTKGFLNSWSTREPLQAGGNFIVNNDFEYTAIATGTRTLQIDSIFVPAWDIRARICNGSHFDIVMPNPSGSQYMMLSRQNGINEYIRCSYYYDSNVQYRLKFYWSSGNPNRPPENGGNLSRSMSVTLGNQLLFPAPTIPPSHLTWEEVIIDFYPESSGTQILEFRADDVGENELGAAVVDLVTMARVSDLNLSGEIGSSYTQMSHLKNNLLFHKQANADLTLSYENLNGSINLFGIRGNECLQHMIYKFNIYGIDE